MLATGEGVTLRENAPSPCAEVRDGVLGCRVIVDDSFEWFVTLETVAEIPEGD
ncbi:hypothetical protein [Streptomyces kronopolitis]|uniref:hypothetical protein n=1 Tax=Streptomyces kronopolitis TaxID=1612435 RepID=UPI003D9A08E8